LLEDRGLPTFLSLLLYFKETKSSSLFRGRFFVKLFLEAGVDEDLSPVQILSLPRDLREAQRLAQGRESWMKGRTRLAIGRNRPVRHAVEIRHDSFLQESFPRLLRKYGIALVTADTAGKWPQREDVTADFIYCVCTRTRKFMPVGTRGPRSGAGLGGSRPGVPAENRATRGAFPAYIRSDGGGMSTAISTTTR
jgi:hypothetical protein